MSSSFAIAIRLTIMLSFLPATLSKTTSDVSITMGGAAKIPCPFDEGALRNIYWYYLDASGPRMILSLVKYVEEIDEAYTDRAGLDKDNSTLILQEVTIDDEGTYRCDVDRLEQPTLINITITLSVFVLSPGTPPVIKQCLQEQPDSSPCTLTSEGPTNLTCQLTNVYPVTNLSLGWYQDGRGPLEAPFSMSETKEDGSFDLETNVVAFETGKWLCNASYLSAYGIEETSASILLTILDKNDTGSIDDEILANIAEEVTDESDLSKLGRHLGIRQFKLNQIIKENEQAKDVFPATSMLFTWKEKTPAAKQVPKMVKALEQSDMENLITEHFPNEAGVTDKKLFELADSIQDEEAIEQLGINFGFRQFKVNQYLNMNKDRGDRSGTSAMLLEWRKKTPRTAQIRDLVDALKNAGVDGSFNNN
ncbi:uncharacterized protein LOC129266548 [Lytechinus pictus]|uniref:uncharacterized protein LOC129266548 n=1 Tax=Lytechinus pictus TaxID=7653 RepID=UPI0030B9AE15